MSYNKQPGLRSQRAEPTSTGEVETQSSMIGTANESPRVSPQPANELERSIELHIEELSLDGFDPANRYVIGEAVERELARLFAEQDVTPTITYPNETAEVNGGLLETDLVSNAEAIGARVARAIYGGLSR